MEEYSFYESQTDANINIIIFLPYTIFLNHNYMWIKTQYFSQIVATVFFFQCNVITAYLKLYADCPSPYIFLLV